MNTVQYILFNMLVQRPELIAALLTVTGSNLRRHPAIAEPYVPWRRYSLANATLFAPPSQFSIGPSKSGTSIDKSGQRRV